MNSTFEREYYLRTADFDCFGRFNPAAVLDLFQDVAGLHANELGCGYDDFIKEHMIWVLVRVKFEIIASPVMFQRVRVRTWPLAPSRAGFQREYLITDESGSELVKGSSDWVIMHSEKRRLMPAKDVYPIKEGFEEKRLFEEKLSKLHDFEDDGISHIFTPGFSDIDINGHVNNTKYTNFVLDAISPEKEDKIKTLQIDYRHEVLSGTELTIRSSREDNILLAKGLNSDGEVMFVCRLEFE